MPSELAIIDAPSSAGAYSPGQERAPAALRGAGLIERLTEAGIAPIERGAVPPYRWRSDRGNPRAQNVGPVVEAARATARLVEAAGEERTLVLGGDCTVGIGTVAGRLAAPGDVGLVYFDLHADLNVPESTVDGALDWMGVAHMLAEPGAVPELAGLGPRKPMLEPSQLVLFGFDPAHASDYEREAIERRSLAVVGVEEIAADPTSAAERALARLEGCEQILVHFDVDVIDFLDAPLSENVERDAGLPLDAAIEALATLLATDRFRALTLTELNPDHGAEDGSTLTGFVEKLVAALAG